MTFKKILRYLTVVTLAITAVFYSLVTKLRQKILANS